MEQNKLNKILNEHKLWLNGMDGKRADLYGANLRDLKITMLIWPSCGRIMNNVFMIL